MVDVSETIVIVLAIFSPAILKFLEGRSFKDSVKFLAQSFIEREQSAQTHAYSILGMSLSRDKTQGVDVGDKSPPPSSVEIMFKQIIDSMRLLKEEVATRLEDVEIRVSKLEHKPGCIGCTACGTSQEKNIENP